MSTGSILGDTLLQDGCPDLKNHGKSKKVQKNWEQFSPLRLQVVVYYLWIAFILGTYVDVTGYMRIASSLTLGKDRIFMFWKVDHLLLNSWGVHCAFFKRYVNIS